MFSSDPDTNWGKFQDPDPNIVYFDPQHCLECTGMSSSKKCMPSLNLPRTILRQKLKDFTRNLIVCRTLCFCSAMMPVSCLGWANSRGGWWACPAGWAGGWSCSTVMRLAAWPRPSAKNCSWLSPQGYRTVASDWPLESKERGTDSY